jgi:hypothetical protein
MPRSADILSVSCAAQMFCAAIGNTKNVPDLAYVFRG